MNKILVATRLNAQIHSVLMLLAEKRERTVAYLVRKAVEQYVERENKEIEHQ